MSAVTRLKTSWAQFAKNTEVTTEIHTESCWAYTLNQILTHISSEQLSSETLFCVSWNLGTKIVTACRASSYPHVSWDVQIQKTVILKELHTDSAHTQ